MGFLSMTQTDMSNARALSNLTRSLTGRERQWMDVFLLRLLLHWGRRALHYDCAKSLVLSSTFTGHLLCSGENNGTFHIWILELDCLITLIHLGTDVVLTLFLDTESLNLVRGAIASVVYLY